MPNINSVSAFFIDVQSIFGIWLIKIPSNNIAICSDLLQRMTLNEMWNIEWIEFFSYETSHLFGKCAVKTIWMVCLCVCVSVVELRRRRYFHSGCLACMDRYFDRIIHLWWLIQSIDLNSIQFLYRCDVRRTVNRIKLNWSRLYVRGERTRVGETEYIRIQIRKSPNLSIFHSTSDYTIDQLAGHSLPITKCKSVISSI